jgi:hypothetical protein
MYRLQVHDARTTGMHWQIGKGGGFHHAVAEGRGESLPVTVFLGGPPALVLAAIAPLPENLPELMLASLLAGRRLERCPGPGEHPLVASAEMALVGHVPPSVRHPEGPFGDHYGYYSLRHDYPVFRVEALCRRRDAIYPATVVGKPRQEDSFIGDLLQELLSPLFPLVMPGVVDLWSYGEPPSSTSSRARAPRPTSTSSRRACGSAWATRCASCRGSSARRRRPRPRSRTCASSAAAASWSAARPRRRSRSTPAPPTSSAAAGGSTSRRAAWRRATRTGPTSTEDEPGAACPPALRVFEASARFRFCPRAGGPAAKPPADPSGPGRRTPLGMTGGSAWDRAR